MRNECGYAVVSGPFGIVECSTATCAHCNSVVHYWNNMPPDEMGGFCRMCMKPTCKKCADGECAPFEKKLEAMEAAARARRSYG
jgi:hypothetical protein